MDAGSCCSEAGLELKRMLVLEQLLVCCQATFQKSDDASHDVREFDGNEEDHDDDVETIPTMTLAIKLRHNR